MKSKKLIPLLFAVLLAAYTCASKSAGTSAPVPSKKIAAGVGFIIDLAPKARGEGLELNVKSSGELKYTVFKLKDPRRLVIDMPNTDTSAFTAPFEITMGVAYKVNSTYFPKTENSRIEIFLSEPVRYKVTRLTDSNIVVDVNPLVAEAVPVGPEREIGEGETEILSMVLREASGLARILITYNGPKPEFKMTRKRGIKRISLDIFNSRVKRRNETLHTVEARGSIVQKVAMFQYTTKEAPVVKVIANLSEFTSSNSYEKEGKLILDIGSEAVLAQTSVMKDEAERKKVVEVSKSKVKRPEDYTGQKISLDFQNADIHNILRILADVSGLNIITSDKVQGKVTMKLVNVPWDLALDMILKNNRLAVVRMGNILRVATQTELQKEQAAKAEEVKIVENVEPLYLKVFQVNYESVEALKANLETIKSSRGTIDINARTNTLIIQDTRDRLAEMEDLIEVLDRQTKQVLIEARIVEINHSYSRELGIRWGGQITAATSNAFPATIGLSGVSEGLTGRSSTAGSIVDLPTSGATGRLGILLGAVDSTALLDMQLMAMQNKGKGRIISMPKITTMDNKEAIIESGREIPYQTVSADGTQTAFKKATLMLKVTPHVTVDRYIRLEIEAHKDEADFANQLPNSPPPIITKNAKTEVLVKDGDTTVIGGLFKDNSTTSSSGVPFLSSIPVLGWLFKSKADTSTGEELLIFITPKIL